MGNHHAIAVVIGCVRAVKAGSVCAWINHVNGHSGVDIGIRSSAVVGITCFRCGLGGRTAVAADTKTMRVEVNPPMVMADFAHVVNVARWSL